jgi:hypothetical protein
MQKQQALTINAQVAGATLKCKSSNRYTVMLKQQALYCNAEAAGATL